jgi:hypothetical protein
MRTQMEPEAIEALRLKTKEKQRRKTDLARFDPTLKQMMDADISLPVILTWLFEEKQTETTLPALRRYIRRVFGEEFYENFLFRNGWQRTKQQRTKTIPVHEALYPSSSTKPTFKPASHAFKTKQLNEKAATSVDRVKEITQGHFDPNQFTDDE